VVSALVEPHIVVRHEIDENLEFLLIRQHLAWQLQLERQPLFGPRGRRVRCGLSFVHEGAGAGLVEPIAKAQRVLAPFAHPEDDGGAVEVPKHA
jgi:hypothetical protein